MSLSNHFDSLTTKLTSKSFWSSLFHNNAEEQRKFTPQELRNLFDILQKNPTVSESNKAVVVETVRSIAEFMIWGDQNEPRIFDAFLENNVMVRGFVSDRCICIH